MSDLKPTAHTQQHGAIARAVALTFKLIVAEGVGGANFDLLIADGHAEFGIAILESSQGAFTF